MEKRNLFSTISFIYRAFYPYRWSIALLGVLGVVSSILAGFGVGAIIPLMTFVLEGSSSEAGKAVSYIIKVFKFLPFSLNVTSLLIFIIILFVMRAIVLFIFSYVRARTEYNYRMRTIQDVFSSILSARWPFLLRQKGGYLHAFMMQDVEKGAVLHAALAHFILSVITSIMFLAFSIAISPKVTFYTIIGGVIVLFLLRPLLKKTRSISAQFVVQTKNVSQYLVEHLAGLKSIKTSVAEKNVFKKGSQEFENWRKTEFKLAILGSLNRGSLEPLSIIFIAYVFALSYHAPDFSIQVFAATLFFIQRTFVYLEGIQASLHTINAALPNVVHLTEFSKALATEGEKSEGEQPFVFSQALRFARVGFSYSKETPILKDVDFSIKKGEMVGLIGSSGSGKTSIADLLMRLFSPTEGAILLDNIDSRRFNINGWRDRIGYVSQDIFLLNDTVENNIKFYNKEVSEEEMFEAAQKANIYNFIQELPDGFATFVGDRGVMLSGGQRQRIVLARILARRPDILILDEATSSLDNESELLIQKAIQDLHGKVTVFVIAHRLSTVMDVDRLLVLSKGKIIEEGKPYELLARPDSYFYRMYHLKEA